MTDKQKILKYLKSNRYITCVIAIHQLSVYNLRSRASEMSELKSELVEIIRNDGVKTRVAKYSLI